MRRTARLTLSLVLVLMFGLVMVGEGAVHDHDYDWPQDLGGRTIRLSHWWLTVTPLGRHGEYSWYDPDPRLQAWIEEVEEWFNITIEFVDRFDDVQAAEQILTQFIAGDISFDYATITRHNLLTLHAEGLIKPLDEVFVDDYLEAIPDRWIFLYRPPLSAHKMFGTPYMFQDMGYSLEEVGIVWNKEMFAWEGLPTPYELWDEDEWTMEALTTLAQQLTQDTTGDGEIDQWGIGHLSGTLDRFWNNLLVINEAALTKEREGRMEVTITEPQAIWMWEWMAEMYHDLEVASDAGRWYQGNAAMQPAWFNSLDFRTIGPDAEDNTFGFLPFPQGPDAEYLRVATGNIWMGVMPVTEQNPRAIAEVVNALHRFKYPYIEPGLPRQEQKERWYDRFWEEWELVVWDRESVEFLRDMTPRVAHSDHLQGAADQVGFWDAVDQINEGRGVATVMSEIEPAFQVFIDEMYEQ